MKNPIFVSGIEFEGPGSRFTLGLRKGSKVYEFSTNYEEIYPKKIYYRNFEEAEEERKNLEALIAENTEAEFSVETFGNEVLEMQMEKKDFENLSKELQKGFQKKPKTKAMWEIKHHRKVNLTPELKSILDKNLLINEAISDLRWKLRDLYADKKEEEYDFWKNRVSNAVNDKDYLQIEEDLEAVIIDNKFNKGLRQHLKDKINIIMDGINDLELNYVNVKNLKYTTANVFAQSVHFKYEKRIKTDLTGLLRGAKKKGKYEKEILSLRDNILGDISELERIVKEKDNRNEAYIDRNRMKTFLYLNIMSRNQDKKINIDGLEFLTKEDGTPERLNYEEFQNLPRATFDIEKFLWDSIFEIISHCGLKIVSYDDLREEIISRFVDTVRESEKEFIDDYRIRHEHWEHRAIVNTAKTISDSNPFTMHVFNANYDIRNYRQSLDFFLGLVEKPPRKEVTIEKDEEGKDFMGRYGLRNQEIIDWYKFLNIYGPHFLQRRLEVFLNYLWKKSGIERKWEKSQDYDQGRENDLKWVYLDSEDPEKRSDARKSLLENNFYTKEDVEELDLAINSSYGKAMIRDMFDIRDTFNISLTQITSISNTVRNYHEQIFYEVYRRFLDPSFFREEKRKLIKNFKANYTYLKKKTFKNKNLEMYTKHKPHEEVFQYYFSPEMNIASYIGKFFFRINEFVEDTKKIEDHERQIGRLQYVRAFFIPMMAEYTSLRKKKEEIVEDLNKNKYVSIDAEHPLNQLFCALKENIGDDKKIGMFRFYNEIKNFFYEFYSQNINPANSRTKGLLEELITYRNISRQFQDEWVTNPIEIESYIDKTFQKATDVLNNNHAEPIALTGKFIFCRNNLPEDEAIEAGLFNLRKLPVYRFGKEMEHVVFFSENRYSNIPEREIATDKFTLFEIKTINELMDHIFKRNYRAALKTVAAAARNLNNIESIIRHRDDPENIEFFESLLRHIRKRKIYKTYLIKDGKLKPFELSEDVKHRFTPEVNLDYFKGYFFGNLFGVYNHNWLSQKLIEKKHLNKALTLSGRISELLTGFYPLEEQSLTKNQKREIKYEEAVNAQANLFSNEEFRKVHSTYEPNDLYIDLLKNKSEEEANKIIGKMMEYVLQ